MELSVIISTIALIISVLALVLNLIRHFETIASADYDSISAFITGLVFFVLGLIFIVGATILTFVLGPLGYARWLIDLESNVVTPDPAYVQDIIQIFGENAFKWIQFLGAIFIGYAIPLALLLMGSKLIKDSFRRYQLLDEEE